MDGTAIKAMMAEIAPVIRDFVAETQGPLLARIASLEGEKAALGARCKALEETAAKPVEIDLVPVEKLIEAEIAKIPAPEPAKEVDREEIAQLVSEAIAAIPAPQDGKSVDIEDVLPAIVAEVEKAVAAIPVPKDGRDGRDGRGVRELLIDRDGNLVASLDDGEMKILGPVAGKDGQPGKDGRDGFSLEDFDVQPIDERTIDLRFTKGDVTHSFELTFPVPIYRGVFKQGETYTRGDVVTWGGHAWHCEKDTAEKPDTADWGQMVKKGRDGKDAK